MNWTIIFITLSGIQFASGDHEGSSDPLDWLRASIPGEPGTKTKLLKNTHLLFLNNQYSFLGVDYPIFNEIQDTSFSCSGKLFGGKKSIFLMI